jgi:hypothetical protein
MRGLPFVFALLAIAVLGGCTLLLPTDELIQPCTANEDCDEGFECQENACLPIDEEDTSEDEE